MLSQFSLRGLRRLVMPLVIVIASVLLIAVWIPGWASYAVARAGGCGSARCWPSRRKWSNSRWYFSSRSFSASGRKISSNFKRGPLPAFIMIAPIALMVLAQPDFGDDRDDRAGAVRDAVCGGRANQASGVAAGGRAARHSGDSGGSKTYRMRRLSRLLRSMADRARLRAFS